MDLEQELATYEAKRAELCAQAEGKYVVIYRGDILAVVDNEDEALRAGYDRVPPEETFLVRQVLPGNQIETFTRPVFVPAPEVNDLRDIG